MSVAPKTGRVTYMGKPVTWAVEQKSTGSVQFNVELNLHAYKNGKGWEMLEAPEHTIAYLNIIKKDGQPNQINVESLVGALGWDGSVKSLQDSDWSQTELQVVIDDETDQEGKPVRKVQFVNPKDYVGGGGVEKADSSTIQSLDAKYGSLLKAVAGNGPKSSKPPLASPNASMGKTLAWTTFSVKCDEYTRENPEDAYNTARKTDLFKKLFSESFPGAKGDDLTAAQWAKFKQEIEKDFSPAIAGMIPI